MNSEVIQYLPLVSPIVTLVAILLGVFFNNRHLDARIADLQRYVDIRIADTSARFEAVLRAEISAVRAEIAELRVGQARIEGRIDRLENIRLVR